MPPPNDNDNTVSTDEMAELGYFHDRNFYKLFLPTSSFFNIFLSKRENRRVELAASDPTRHKRASKRALPLNFPRKVMFALSFDSKNAKGEAVQGAGLWTSSLDRERGEQWGYIAYSLPHFEASTRHHLRSRSFTLKLPAIFAILFGLCFSKKRYSTSLPSDILKFSTLIYFSEVALITGKS